MRKLLALVATLSLLSGLTFLACSPRYAIRQTTPDRAPSSIQGLYTSLDSAAWSHLDTTRGMGEVLIKFFVINDAKGRPSELYYQDSKAYEFHHQALQNFGDFKGKSRKEIEDLAAKGDPRRLYLGVLVMPVKGDNDNRVASAYYLMSQDLPPAPVLRKLQDLLVASFKVGFMKETLSSNGRLPLRPLAHQKNLAIAAEKELAAAGVLVDFSSRSRPVEAYNDGWGFGRLTHVRDQADLDERIKSGEVNEQSVLLAESELRELPPVAGVISGVPLINASHLVLLAQMYGIPLVYDSAAIASLKVSAGTSVFLSTAMSQPNEYELALDLAPLAVKRLQSLKRGRKLEVAIDLQASAIRPARELGFNDVPAYGGKASQFGVIQRTIPGNSLASAAAVPVSYSRRFFTEAPSPDGNGSLWDWIQARIAAIPASASYLDVDAALETVRKGIKKTAVPAALVEQIRADLVRTLQVAVGPTLTEVRVKVRSSSNVEDGAEFNGAGLYDSKGACLLNCDNAEPKKQLGVALNKVWQSLYSTRGYWARRKFGVPETQVAMGLLVHAPFKGEEANGVVRFQIRRDSAGDPVPFVEIVSAPGGDDETVGEDGGLVTGGGDGARPEVVQIDGEFFRQTQPFERRPMGSLIMPQAQYEKLGKLMAEIYRAYPASPDLQIEAEWKLMPAGATVDPIMLKQVRRVPQRQSDLPTGDRFALVFSGATRLKPDAKLNLGQGPWVFYRPSEIALSGLGVLTEGDLKAGRNIVVPRIEMSFGQDQPVAQSNVEFRVLPEDFGTSGGQYTLESVGPLTGTPEGTLLKIALYTSAGAKPRFVGSESATLSWELDFSPQSRPEVSKVLTLDFARVSYQSRADQLQAPAGKDTDWALKTRKFGNPKKGVSGTYEVELLRCGYDDCSYQINNLVLKGALPGKTLKIVSDPVALHEIHKHEGLGFAWIDLQTAQGISTADRAALIKTWGRYLVSLGGGGGDSTDPGDFLFLTEKGDARNLLGKPAGIQSATGGGDE